MTDERLLIRMGLFQLPIFLSLALIFLSSDLTEIRYKFA